MSQYYSCFDQRSSAVKKDDQWAEGVSIFSDSNSGLEQVPVAYRLHTLKDAREKTTSSVAEQREQKIVLSKCLQHVKNNIIWRGELFSVARFAKSAYRPRDRSSAAEGWRMHPLKKHLCKFVI